MNDLSEKEQLEEMRTWWAENGRFVITGVVLGVAIIFGWNQWQSSIAISQTEASNLFEEVMVAVETGDTAAAEVAASNLFENYDQTVYPGQTRLAMARLYMEKGRDQDAADVLRDLIGSDIGSDNDSVGQMRRGLTGKDDGATIRLVGRLRLAKIMLYQNKPDEVVELLKDRGDGGFAARYSEVLGDAYAAQGNFAEAQAAYLAALGERPTLQTIDTNLVQLKLNDLPDLAELATTSAAIEAAIDAGQVADVAEDAAESVDDPAEAEAQDDAEPEPETGQ